jgi:hypothetical protein
MRHAMMRLWQQVGVDAHWFVPPGDSNVFNVTKRKFHVSSSFSFISRPTRKLIFDCGTERSARCRSSLHGSHPTRQGLVRELGRMVLQDFVERPRWRR